MAPAPSPVFFADQKEEKEKNGLFFHELLISWDDRPLLCDQLRLNRFFFKEKRV